MLCLGHITLMKIFLWEDGLESREGGRDTATSAEENEHKRISDTEEDHPVHALPPNPLLLFIIT